MVEIHSNMVAGFQYVPFMILYGIELKLPEEQESRPNLAQEDWIQLEQQVQQVREAGRRTDVSQQPNTRHKQQILERVIWYGGFRIRLHPRRAIRSKWVRIAS